jgi:hypothetical protein
MASLTRSQERQLRRATAAALLLCKKAGSRKCGGSRSQSLDFRQWKAFLHCALQPVPRSHPLRMCTCGPCRWRSSSFPGGRRTLYRDPLHYSGPAHQGPCRLQLSCESRWPCRPRSRCSHHSDPHVLQQRKAVGASCFSRRRHEQMAPGRQFFTARARILARHSYRSRGRPDGPLLGPIQSAVVRSPRSPLGCIGNPSWRRALPAPSKPQA